MTLYILFRIALVILPVMFICAWLLHLIWRSYYLVVPPMAAKKPRKRPIDMGPETRFVDQNMSRRR